MSFLTLLNAEQFHELQMWQVFHVGSTAHVAVDADNFDCSMENTRLEVCLKATSKKPQLMSMFFVLCPLCWPHKVYMKLASEVRGIVAWFY